MHFGSVFQSSGEQTRLVIARTSRVQSSSYITSCTLLATVALSVSLWRGLGKEAPQSTLELSFSRLAYRRVLSLLDLYSCLWQPAHSFVLMPLFIEYCSRLYLTTYLLDAADCRRAFDADTDMLWYYHQLVRKVRLDCSNTAFASTILSLRRELQ